MKLRNEAFRIFFMWVLPLRKERGSAGRDVCIRVEHTPELLKRQVKLMLVRRERIHLPLEVTFASPSGSTPQRELQRAGHVPFSAADDCHRVAFEVDAREH